MGSRAPRAAVLLCAGAMLFAGGLRAQGCSQCRDNVAQTNPAVQASYRGAIGLMVGAVAVVCGAMVIVMRRLR